jgi:hypothetical protein
MEEGGVSGLFKQVAAGPLRTSLDIADRVEYFLEHHIFSEKFRGPFHLEPLGLLNLSFCSQLEFEHSSLNG